MSSDRTLSNLHARAEPDERNRPSGLVEVYGLPDWLKTDRFVSSYLTPTEARLLAIQLIQSAERASGGTS